MVDFLAQNEGGNWGKDFHDYLLLPPALN